MNIKSTLFILSFLLFSFITFNSCTKLKNDYPRDLMDVLKAGRLKVITDSSSIGSIITGDSISGLQYEIIKAFSDSLGVELQITVKNDMYEAINGLAKGEFDIIANILPVTTEFKNELLFSQPLITTRQMLVQRVVNDSVQVKFIKTQSELANDTIYLPFNSPSIMRINHLSDEIAEPIYIEQMKNVNFEDMIRLVSEGKIKNTICPEQYAKKYQLQYPNLDFSLPLGFSQNYSWAVHKNSTHLMEALNDFLNEFIGSSDYWNLYRKYY